MSIEPTELLSRLNTASFEVDDLARKARSLRDRVAGLDEKQLASMPRFAGPWTKQSIEVHIERLEEVIKKPIRARNRNRLKEAGFVGKLANPEVLDDSTSVDEIRELIAEITVAAPQLNTPLLDSAALPRWLDIGTGEAKSKLRAIKQSLDGFARLQSSGLQSDQLADLLAASIQEPSTLKQNEARATKAVALQRLGIALPASEKLVSAWGLIGSTYESATTLQSQYPESFDELKPALQNKSLDEATALLSNSLLTCTNVYIGHEAEWRRLHQTLSLLGAAPASSSPPRSISAIEKQIEEFRQRCSERLGPDGMRLMGFLQGNGDFPRDMGMKEVESALLALRPFIKFEHGESNA